MPHRDEDLIVLIRTDVDSCEVIQFTDIERKASTKEFVLQIIFPRNYWQVSYHAGKNQGKEYGQTIGRGRVAKRGVIGVYDRSNPAHLSRMVKDFVMACDFEPT